MLQLSSTYNKYPTHEANKLIK